LGIVSGRDDNGSRGHGSLERSRFSRWRDGLWLAERGLGGGSLRERALCSGADWAGGSTRINSTFDAVADFCHGPGSVFASAGAGSPALRVNGIGSRSKWRRDEYEFDGAGSETRNGACAEHILLLRDFSASGAGAVGGLDCFENQSSGRVWSHCGCLRSRIWQCQLADSGAARGGGDEGVAEDWCGTCPLPLVLKLFGCPGQKEKDNNSARSADKSVCSTQARDTGILLSYLWET